MTTILGVQHRNGFTLAADGQTSNNDRPYFHSDLEKIIRVGHLWVACAGSARFSDVASNIWKPPVYDKTLTPYKYLVTKAVPSLRTAIESAGVVLKDEETFQMLIGVQGRLFEIASDYTVLANTTYGIGSGSMYGLGALAAGADIETAIKIASKLDIYTGGKIQIVKQGVNDA